MNRADFLRIVVLAPLGALLGRTAVPEDRIQAIMTETFDPYEIRMFHMPARKEIWWSYQNDSARW